MRTAKTSTCKSMSVKATRLETILTPYGPVQKGGDGVHGIHQNQQKFPPHQHFCWRLGLVRHPLEGALRQQGERQEGGRQPHQDYDVPGSPRYDGDRKNRWGYRVPDLDIHIRVSRTAAGMNGTTGNLKENYYMKLIDILFAMMLPSGNDAAYLLAENFGLLLYCDRVLTEPQQKAYCNI